MAKPQAPPSEGMDEITCLLCNKLVHDPKYLPCLHFYCRECIQKHVNVTNQLFWCPTCRKKVTLSQSDACKLPAALTIDSMKELHCRLSQGEIECGLCSESKPSEVNSYCRDCNEFICNLCEGAHHRMKTFKSHEVVTMSILKQNIRQNLPHKRRLSKCPGHSEDLDMYCSTCEELICMKCSTDQPHSNHEYGLVKQFAPEAKEELGENLKMLKKLTNAVTCAIKTVENVKSQITDQAEKTRPEICQGFKEALQVIEERRQELLKSMDSITQEKLKDLEDQLKRLNSSSRELTKLTKSIEQQLTTGNNTEVMALRSWMLDRIQEESKKYETLELEPVALANISVKISCARQIAELLQQCTTVSFLADPSKCNVEKESLRLAETDMPVTVNVHTLYPNGQPCREEQGIQVELRSLARGSLVPTEINSKGKGTYEISFCPGIRGRHELNVKIHGIQISGSPFKFFVEHHPTKLKKPVDCIKGLESPYGAAFNYNGDLLVTQTTAIGIIRKEERGGYSLNSVHGLDHMQHPTGIATNEKLSCTYVTDSGGDCVMKYTNWNWECVSYTRGHPEEFRRPGRVKISPDQKLYICDRGNDRIQVFDRDLKFVKMFETEEEFGRPVDIAFDDTGHIYVSDLNRNQILKFTSQGVLKLAIGNHGSGPGELSSPRGLYIHKNFIYVNERDNQRVSVFSTISGEFVTMFGTEPKILNPASIIADEDGFLYLCDEEGNCVFVF